MSASVPWSVNAVEPEAWAAARDAARRAGMSVGEWLETAIRENAGETNARRGRRRAPPPDDRLEDIAEQLDELIGRAPDFAQAGQQAAKVNAGIHRSLDALNERIEALVKGTRAEPQIPAPLQSAIERLDARLEALIAKGRTVPAPAPELDRKLADIARSVEAVHQKLERKPEPAPAPTLPPAAPMQQPASIAELDAAVVEITMHQVALDGDVPSPDLARRFAAIHAGLEAGRRENQLTELEQQFRSMVDDVHALRRDSVQAGEVEALRREIADLSFKLTDLAPRRSLEAIEGAVDALAQRIDRSGIAGSDDNLAQIVDALKAIRQALNEVQPAENFAAVERDLHALSGKLDALGAKGVDHLAIARLQAEATEIREVLANALPSDALKALVEQIELLVAKFERVAAPGNDAVRDLVGALERRIEGLAGRLESTAQGALTADLLETIGRRIDELQRALDTNGSRANGGLETALRSIADKVDGAQARLAHLDVIERELSSLSSGLREVQSSVTVVAEHAARSAVRELAAGAAAARPAPQPAPQPAPIPETIPNFVVRAPAPEPKAVLRTPEPYVRPASERPAAAPQIDGGLPADFPLEPGSGGPRQRTAQSAAERIALSEAALGAFSPKAAPTETRTSDFIAAARRAAQAANAETARAPEAKPNPASALFAAATSTTRSRALVIGLAGMLLIYGTVRYHDVILGGLFSFASKPGKVSAVLPAAIDTIAPAEVVLPVKQSQAHNPDDRDFAGVPPAGMLSPPAPRAEMPATPRTEPPVAQRTEAPAAPRAETPADPEETGSTPAPPRLTAAPPNAAFTGQPGELPGEIPAALRAAALAGNPAATYEIGARWFEGRGVVPNGEQAQRWFEQAIAKGSIHAAYRLGTMHEKGQGIPKNPNEARRLYLLAAEAGHARAMHNLAVLHAEGIDGKPDMKAAARWFRLAADRGVRDSEYNLGVMYARGAGVTQNLAESYRWFALAAAQGDTEAAKKRDDVGGRLDAQSLVAAKLAVQTWTATPLDPAVNDVQIKPEWQIKAETPGAPRKKQTKN
jgi:localization factor PodJL